MQKPNECVFNLFSHINFVCKNSLMGDEDGASPFQYVCFKINAPDKNMKHWTSFIFSHAALLVNYRAWLVRVKVPRAED